MEGHACPKDLASERGCAGSGSKVWLLSLATENQEPLSSAATAITATDGGVTNETVANIGLRSDDPMMKAWIAFCETDEFKDVLRWSTATQYDDGRPIDDLQREQHVKGGLWLAFTKGLESDALHGTTK